MSKTESLEESTLLALLAEDSEYAFQLLFDRYQSLIYRMAMMYVKSPALAEDIVQDVFLKLWFQRKNLSELSSLEAWICVLTKNFTLNCLKKLAHEWTARSKWANEHESAESDTDHRIRNTQYKALLSEAIARLPLQQRKVYLLAKEGGLSYEAIGHQLSLSPLTIKTHISRALAAIRAYLQEHDREFLIFFMASYSVFKENF